MASERMTSASLPGVFGSGWADYGRLSAPEIIASARTYARASMAVATAILSAADEDFRVETYVGSAARKRLEVIQSGRKIEP